MKNERRKKNERIEMKTNEPSFFNDGFIHVCIA